MSASSRWGGLLGSAVAVTLLVALRQVFAQRELLATHRELELAHAELAALDTTDPVTLLPNHRALAARINQEVARSRRLETSCAVVFLDVDHFKALNDNFGHAVGDVALREIGAIARSTIRTMDTVGRWGGEEFVLLLPDTGQAAALLATERVRREIAAHRIASTDTRLTCSLGVAVYPDDGGTRSELIESADRAMYAAKRFGRNQAFAASHPAVGAFDGSSHPQTSRDEDALTGAVEALALLVDERDSYTNVHARGVSELSRRLAIELGCDPDDTAAISMAARLHDIGKVAVPDSILMKPGRLTDEEWILMRKHPVVSADVLRHIPALRPLAPLVHAHHERWDGTGYPDRVAGEDIPLGARIICVADAFNAMITRRPYSAAIDPDAGLAELERCSGTQFDPRVVKAARELPRPTAGSHLWGMQDLALGVDASPDGRTSTPSDRAVVQAAEVQTWR
jgi:diguanylate cyclase (GGDEF)-like protein